MPTEVLQLQGGNIIWLNVVAGPKNVSEFLHTLAWFREKENCFPRMQEEYKSAKWTYISLLHFMKSQSKDMECPQLTEPPGGTGAETGLASRWRKDGVKVGKVCRDQVWRDTR